MQNKIFHVSGTHCASCKILIEDILQEETSIKNVKVNLSKEVISLESDLVDENIIELVNNKIASHGYRISLEKELFNQNNRKKTWQAFGLGLVFLILFYLLQKSGILNFGFGGEIKPISAFVIGIVASLSSCLAVVGGLVLSLSAKVAEDKGGKQPIVLFHLGRLVGFAFLGGLLGILGSKIGFNFVFSSILGIIASLIMILLGLNLIGVLKKNKFTLPDSIFRKFRAIEHSFWGPLLVGLGTFFLPCGFTQSMQVIALSSESFVSGSLIMFMFALGTLPVLALLSFGAVSFTKSEHAKLFLQAAGFVVLGLGLFAITGALASLGVISPIFYF